MIEKWNSFECDRFIFEGHDAIVVRPDEGNASGNLAVKTEYWDKFTGTEIELLRNGFHLCFIRNDNRWGTDPDLDRKARFIRYVQNKYFLKTKCVPVGMSCGGLIAIKLAAKYPELVSCMYLDAPTINYMSCPCGFGVSDRLELELSEVLDALGLSSVSELLAYRDMPLDKIPILAQYKIPVVLVSGDSDSVVPFCENGAYLEIAYKNACIPLAVYIKPGAGHHPHGLEDPAPIVRFILQNC